MKRGWVVYNHSLESLKYREQLALYQEGGKACGVEVELVASNTLGVGVMNGKLFLKKSIDAVDFVLFLDKDIRIAEQLEQMGLKVYNSSQSIALCDNKAATFQALANKNFPLPDTIFSPKSFREMERGSTDLDWIVAQLGMPLVVKECYGSYGEQVYLAKSMQQLQILRYQIGLTAHLFQRFVASSAGKDVRLYVVGDRVVGTMARENTNDFRANLSSGGGIVPYEPTQEVLDLAVASSQALKLTFSGVDILFAEDGSPLLCEVNSSAHIKNFYDFFQWNLAEAIWKEIVTLSAQS